MSEMINVNEFTKYIIFEQNSLGCKVGTSGDFSSLNEAICYFSQYYPAYEKTGVTIRITLQKDFVMQEQVTLSGIDLSWMEIFAEHTVHIDRHALKSVLETIFPSFLQAVELGCR